MYEVTWENIVFKPRQPTQIIVLTGDPCPLKRPRFTPGRVYDSQKNAKLIVGITIQNQLDTSTTDFEPLTGPLHLEIIFFMYTPRLKKKELGKPHGSRPDLSNMLKFYEDIATSILYTDDAQIASVSAKKVYSDEPRTEFRVYKL